MKKQDLIPVVILFALMVAWNFGYPRLFPPKPVPVTTPVSSNAAPSAAATVSATDPTMAAPTTEATTNEPSISQVAEPERLMTLSNTDATVTVTSRGGAIKSVELNAYRQTVERSSQPVVLDFSKQPALACTGLKDFVASADFDISQVSPTEVRFRRTADGILFTRSIKLDATNQYQILVSDTIQNQATQARTIPENGLQMGAMKMGAESSVMGMATLGIDVLYATGGDGVKHWASELPDAFKTEAKEKGLAKAPESILRRENAPIDWLGVKNKYFVQLFQPEGGAASYRLQAWRKILPEERTNPAHDPGKAEIVEVAGIALFSETTLNPGESFTRTVKYYVGPKKYSIIKTLGLHQEDVMEFSGWKSTAAIFTPFCTFLLNTLNWIHSVIPNYGIAIILLTMFLRIVFWPLTHKGSENMKKLQALQPLMNELRAKYKDNPRKQQEATMALYKEHKVNPLSGCLPMLIQIPVFIALFVVLRSAIELRFANFLWIHDLSEAENLFVGALPFALNVNILPLLMAVTMAWQQKLTPTTDPAQQKMMLYFMPIMMLFMFYKMPSALVLYWTTNQCLMIAQMLIQKWRTTPKAVTA